ncbi:putative disease resistance RPP13-like protein 1 isoform X3 [Ananas comosus]|uniref:Disease resistance RPP13-like protein 1 isoform X3 n=1 Tax=Ananas comosus TaxID=4615 RepID=A0A6P5G2R0_ANACO|nr:putative disease resistance RPP13-like protein 1 isoform X3 [Ananas comosus]
MALQDVAAVLEVPVVPEVAAVLERTRQRLSSEVVTEFVSRAGFGAELDRLIGRLTEIYLAVPTAGLPDRAERYWHKEIEDACCFSDRFVDLVREYPHGSLDDGIRLMEEDYDVGCGLKTLLRIFGNLLKRLEFFAAESEILGRDENKEIIFQIILSVVRISNSDHLRLVHISGSEGSGKTALARLVYNDPRVKKYFDCRMWVAVPEDFDVELIVMKIIKCAIRSANRMLDLGSVDKLYDNLRQVLHGRKFFLVLDDVLSVNYDGWELLRSLLSVGEEGSTIITTVNWEEGTNTMIAESGVPYMLEPLPEDVCFDLLVKKAFGTETKVDFRAFSAIGKKIVGKCRGLPLAINMIGEMLRCNPEIPNHLLDYLDSLHTFTKFSYQTLPLHLQWCITYLTLFPYDYAFDKHKVVELWNAEGFISCAHQDDIIEDYSGHFFDILVSYSFLQAVQYPYDQVRELCTLHPSITKLRNLETLNLEGCCKLDSLPESMYSLRELRHLNILGCSSLTTMPRRMGWLSRLQTLSRFIVTAERGRKIEELGSLDNLKGALQIENLEKALDPEDAKRAQLNSKRNITSLALYWSWLNFYNDDNEASDSTVQQVLEALQPPPSLEILDIFSYPGTGAPQWMTNGKSTLKSMVEIRLVNLKRLESLPPLGQFPCLKVIEIRGMNAMTCVDDTFSGNDGMFPKLEKLTFSQMPNLEKWVMEDNQDKFPRLSNLTIAHCPKLKVLHFSCSSLKNLTLLFNNEMLYSTPGALKYFGRSLQKLTIGLCYELVATSTCEALRDLTALKELEISECDELISLPHCMRYLTSLRYMTIMNCRNLKTLPYWLTRSRSRPELLISGCPKLLHQT